MNISALIRIWPTVSFGFFLPCFTSAFAAGQDSNADIPYDSRPYVVESQPNRVRVPQIEGEKVSAAQQAIDRWGLAMAPAVGVEPLDTDVVSRVLPAPGRFVRVGSLLRLELKRRVPNLQGKSIADATRLLNDHGFEFALPDRFLSTDLIKDQQPRAFVEGFKRNYLRVGGAIRIVSVLTEVPDLVGQDLETAATLAEAQNQLNALGIQYEQVGSATEVWQAKVVDQEPRPGQWVDRMSDKVQLKLLVPVPDFRGWTVVETKHRLAQLGMKATVLASEYQAAARVHSFAIEGDVRSLGSDKYCEAGSEFRIRLHSARMVPDIAGMPWNEAIDVLEELKIEWSLATGDRAGTHIYSTAPRAGEKIGFGQSVQLHPGVVVRDVTELPLQEAVAELESLGLRVVCPPSEEFFTRDLDAIGRAYVARQSKIGLVRKQRSSPVVLESFAYAAERIRVPKLAGLTWEQAIQIADDLELSIKVSEREPETVPTDVPELDGVRVLVGQWPRVGVEIDFDKPVLVDRGWYELVLPVPKELVTFGRQPDAHGGQVLTCIISPDRQRGIAKAIHDENGLSEYQMTRVADSEGPNGKLNLVFRVRTEERDLEFHVPFDGVGVGQVNEFFVNEFGQEDRRFISDIEFSDRPPE